MHGNPSAPANTPVAQENVGLEADDRLAYSVNEAAQRLGVGPMTLYRRLGIGGECSTECSGNEVRRWVSEVGDVGGWIGEVTD
jgi:Bacterial regulatory protein, Fis family